MTQEQIQAIREFILASDTFYQLMTCRLTATEKREAIEAVVSARRKLGNTWNTELWQPYVCEKGETS